MDPSGLLSESPPLLERDPEFDEVVDAEGLIEIRGRSFVRSEILATDPIAYREALEEFREAELEELLEAGVERFPHPIAHCLYRYLNSSESENQRLQFLKDTWEALVHVSFALAVAEVRHAGATVSVVAERTRDFRAYIDSRTLRDLLEVVRQTVTASPHLPITGAIVDGAAITRMIELNQRRNEDFAHLSTLNERQSTALIADVEPEVLAILRRARQLENVEFVRYRGPAEKRGHQKLELFTGHSSSRQVQPRLVSSSQSGRLSACSQREVVALWGEDAVSLSPMIIWREGEGHTSQLGFMKKRRVDGGRSIFTFEVFGEAVEFESDAPELMSDLDAVKRLYEAAKGGRP